MLKESVKLYDGQVPGDLFDGFVPMLHYYAAENKTSDGTIVIFPGGGYGSRAPHEGEGYATFFNKNGIDVFVVDYRTKPYQFPAPQLDARRAVRYVRANAEKYGIDPQKISVMGSSAGGHLAASVSTYRPTLDGEELDSLRSVSPIPNGTILCYPVIDMTTEFGHLGSRINLLGDRADELGASLDPSLIADELTPKAFIWHTNEDGGVHVMNSYKYAAKLREYKIPVELHVFPYGRHGLGLCETPERANPHTAMWSELLLRWLKLENL